MPTPAGRTAPTCFEYQRAETWADAIELLDLWDDEAKILAGGQSLIPMLNLRLAFPAALIDINPIPAADPRVDGDHLVIDANTRHRVLTTSEMVRTHAPLLAHAVHGDEGHRAVAREHQAHDDAHPHGSTVATALSGGLFLAAWVVEAGRADHWLDTFSPAADTADAAGVALLRVDGKSATTGVVTFTVVASGSP